MIAFLKELLFPKPLDIDPAVIEANLDRLERQHRWITRRLGMWQSLDSAAL